MKGLKMVFVCLLTLLLVACGKTMEEKWQEKYDLGMRYLTEGSYEEAILAFTAAIEIDAKRDDAYLGAAEAYMQMDDMDAAMAILEEGYQNTESERIRDKMQEVQNQGLLTVLVKQEETEFDGTDERRTVFYYYYDENGYMVRKEDISATNVNERTWTYDTETGKWIFEYKYDSGNICGSEVLDKHRRGSRENVVAGSSRMEGEREIHRITCDPYPSEKTDIVYNSRYGEAEVDWYYAQYEYDEDGNAVHVESYSKDGALLGVCDMEYEVIDLWKNREPAA